MFIDVIYADFFGKPLIFYLGIGSFLLFLATSIVGMFGSKLGIKNHFVKHRRMAIATTILILFHGFIGIYTYL